MSVPHPMNPEIIQFQMKLDDILGYRAFSTIFQLLENAKDGQDSPISPDIIQFQMNSDDVLSSWVRV